MKVIEKIKKQLAEISHGVREVQFAFLDTEKYETVTPFCKCKDFFGDMFWSNINKKPISIYGFTWQPNQDKGVLDKDDIFIAIRITQKGNNSTIFDIKKEEVVGLKNLLNKFETKLEFKLSDTEVCDEGKNIILKVDKKWTERPYLLSGLCMFIRLGLNYTDSKKSPIDFYKEGPSSRFISPNDELYFKKINNRIQDLLNGKIDTKQTYQMYTSASIHNNSGILNYKEYKID